MTDPDDIEFGFCDGSEQPTFHIGDTMDVTFTPMEANVLGSFMDWITDWSMGYDENCWMNELLNGRGHHRLMEN